MSKEKVKQSTSMEDHCYRNGEINKDFFDKIDYKISSILLELSNPVVFSSSDSSSPLFHKWGRTKKRTSLSPTVIKSLSVTEVVEMGSTSSSSCLTGEAKKTDNIPIIKNGLEDEFSTKLSQPNTSCSVFEIQLEEMGLLSGQVGFRSQPIKDGENLCHLQPLMCVDRTVKVKDIETTSLQMDNLERRGFDLNLPATEEGDNSIVALEGFQRVVIGKIQAAAQARQRRLSLIRSKKLYRRFISSHQFK